MKKRYEIIESDLGQSLIMFDENGVPSSVPFDLGNSDYQAYLNKDKPKVEHLTEIIPSGD